VIGVTAHRTGFYHIGVVRDWKALAASLAAVAICAWIESDAGNHSATGYLAPVSEVRQILTSEKLAELCEPDFGGIDSSISGVYEQNGFVPLWISGAGLSPKGQAILDALRLSAARGLNPEDYDVLLLDAWARRLQTSPPIDSRQIAVFDVALTVELTRYAADLHQGRIDPRQVRFAIRPKDRLEPASFLREYLATTRSLADLLEQAEPPFSGYKRTLAALVHYQQLAAQELPQLPARPRLPLRPGENYADLPVLAGRLELLGDLAPHLTGSADNGVYEGPVVEAVRRFQKRHGITETGTIDSATWKALTTPLSKRVEQLALTLERWRWMPSTVRPAIVVNIPEFELRAYNEKRELELRMRVIVGRAYRHKTPVFEDNLESIVVRPWWNVPLSIQRGEMVPQIRRNPDYLLKNRLQILDRNNQPVAWNSQEPLADRLASGDLHLRQEPGPENSLGLLKFDFPNNYSVYMHGTPAHQLFSRGRRDFSHGCIRVQDPGSLAEWVLRGDPNWNRALIAAACEADRTIRIALRQPVAVLVLYGTAVVEENGEAHFFDDIYGYDAELEKALTATRRLCRSHP
jgi:murein L,D-transpeptidase YcbB/YkuD